MNAKHTPGEWYHDQGLDLGQPDTQHNGASAISIYAGGWQVGLVLGNGKGESGANARLIASAPELLEALQNLEEIASLINAKQHAGAEVRPDQWSEMYHCSIKARAAIAKAKGDV